MNPALFRTFFLFLLLAKLAFKTFLNLINYKHLQQNAGQVPPRLEEIVAPDTLKRIDSYQVAKTIFQISSDWLSSAFLLLFLFTPLFPLYTGLIDRLSLPYQVRGVLFFLVLGLIDWLLNLPSDYYYHFTLEARFGFNKYRPGTWLLDAAKNLLLSSVLMSLIFGFVFSVWGNNFHFEWSAVWLGWSLATLLIVTIMFLVPVLFIPLFYKLTPLPDSELKEKVTELVLQSGFQVRGIFVANESHKSAHANASFSGFGKSRTIILFDTLVNNYTAQEILGVLAHEIGHGKKKHTINLMALLILEIFLFIVFASYLLASSWTYQAMGIPKILYSGSFFVMTLFFDGLLYFVQPLFSRLERYQEYQADTFSRQALGSATPLVATFLKFITNELDNLHPHPLYEAFYYSHPSLLKRILALEES